MNLTSKIQHKRRLTQFTGELHLQHVMQVFGLNHKLCFCSQNRLEYEKRVRAQARAMAATE